MFVYQLLDMVGCLGVRNLHNLLGLLTCKVTTLTFRLGQRSKKETNCFFHLFIEGIVKNVLQIVCNSPKNGSRIHQTHFICSFSLPQMTAITAIKLPNIQQAKNTAREGYKKGKKFMPMINFHCELPLKPVLVTRNYCNLQCNYSKYPYNWKPLSDTFTLSLHF